MDQTRLRLGNPTSVSVYLRGEAWRTSGIFAEPWGGQGWLLGQVAAPRFCNSAINTLIRISRIASGQAVPIRAVA